FFTTASYQAGDDDCAGKSSEVEERGELQEDRETSPMSIQAVRTQLHIGQNVGCCRPVDRDREFRQREDEQRAKPGLQTQYTNSNGFVNTNMDRFGQHPTPDQLQQYSPSNSHHLFPSHLQPPQHHSAHPPLLAQTPAMRYGQLEQMGPGTLTTPNPRHEFPYHARVSYIGPTHSHPPSAENDPPSSNWSDLLLVPLVTGGPPPYTNPETAVKPLYTRNAQGHRICWQCDQPGRYKDEAPVLNMFVTLRCRKKMRRIERARTADTRAPLQAISFIQQQPTKIRARL
ncbi:hypothetical protein FRC01_009375, partial [Tulasnella sp. 417]